MIKYDYVELTFKRKAYYISKDRYIKLRDRGDEEYNPISYALDTVMVKANNFQKLKVRKSDSFKFSTEQEIQNLEKELYKIGKPKANKDREKDKIRQKKYALEEKKEKAKKKLDAIKFARNHKLPKGVKPEDLVENWEDRPTDAQTNLVDLRHITPDGYGNSFRMYLVKDWGWCIPTLLISNARHKSGFTDRSYAVRVKDGRTVRVGKGPHVEKEVYVHIKKSNFSRLKPIFKLMQSGAVDANQTRDRISTRMMRRRSYAW